MHCFIYPQQDATIYNDYQEYNTGGDEILDIIKTYFSGSNFSEPNYSRALIKFNIDYVSQSIQSGEIGSEKFYLNLKLAWAVKNKNTPVTLYIYPVSNSWEEGSGKRLILDSDFHGVTWLYRDSETLSEWNQTGSDFISASYYEVSTSLFDNNNTFQENGYYINEISDIRVDVSNIVKSWLSSSIDNNGFLLKLSNYDENSNIDIGKFSFYSLNSNTVNIPKLEVVWDDIIYDSGTLQQIDINDSFIYFKNIKNSYSNKGIYKFDIGVRETYPTKSYSTDNQYITNKILPMTSYYSIVDNVTEETIVPFDNYSKLSCNTNGNYFNLNLKGFFPERYYKIKIKSVSGSNEQYYDNNYIFKVIR